MIAAILFACSGGGDDAGNDGLEGTVSADVAELAKVVVDLSAGAAQMPAGGDPTTSEACYATWGECSFCYELDGGPLTGTYTAGLDAPPCVADRSGRFGTATYTVASFDLAGDWAGSAGGSYAITASGARSADLLVEGQREGRGFDATFTLDSLDATTVDFVLDAFAAQLTYAAFGNRVWIVEMAGTSDTISGTITGDDGTTCSIDGEASDPIVVCAR